MKNTRTVRIAAGTVCLIVVALAMGWFVGRYIPGDPREPEPASATGLRRERARHREGDRRRSGTTLKLSNITQGIKYMHTESDREPLSAAAVENWKESGNWEYDCPDINVSVLETKNHGHRKLCRLVSELQGIELGSVQQQQDRCRHPCLSQNASEEDLVYWQGHP